MWVAGNRTVRCIAFLSLLILACGSEAPSDQTSYGSISVSLAAGKDVFVEISPPEDLERDSLIMSPAGLPETLFYNSGDLRISVEAHLVPGCGSTPEDRKDYLQEMGAYSLSLQDVPALSSTPGFTAVLYTSGGMSVVERTWSLGSGELAILEARAQVGSPNMLLSPASVVLRTAMLIRSQESTGGVYLSDRTRGLIIEEVNADVTVPPDISHHILLEVDPAARMISVTDTVSIDFRPTQADSVLTLFLPSNDTGTDMTAFTGAVSIAGDSAVCSADSSRVFRGVFHGTWSSFASASTDSLTGAGMQIRPTCTFQCGMWFYPGCTAPADYRLTISVPDMGLDVYAPLQEVSRAISDSLLQVTFTSPEGGLMGPLAWAAGGFDRSAISGGRSGFLTFSSDSIAEEVIPYVGELADVIWNGLGFTGARLDFILVRSLDVPVFLSGPGCIFASSEVLASLAGSSSWADSLVAGIPVPETAIAAGVASSFLSGSTWLSPELRQVLSAWIVYRYASGTDSEKGPLMLDAFLRYYLYSAEMTGGIEYALADPELSGTSLEAPVLLGKGPIVIEFLTREIPAFGNALRRALGNLRHAGDTYGRLLSSMGLPEPGEHSELFSRWLYGPGLPRLRVSWRDSLGVLDIRLQQLQPGQDFPLGSVTEQVRVFSDEGDAFVELTPGTAVGRYFGELPQWMEGVTAVDINSTGTLAADIIYIHRAPH